MAEEKDIDIFDKEIQVDSESGVGSGKGESMGDYDGKGKGDGKGEGQEGEGGENEGEGKGESEGGDKEGDGEGEGESGEGEGKEGKGKGQGKGDKGEGEGQGEDGEEGEGEGEGKEEGEGEEEGEEDGEEGEGGDDEQKKVALILKLGKNKGKFGLVELEYDIPDGVGKIYNIDGTDFKGVFTRGEIAFEGDIVDYQYSGGGVEYVAYGEIREWNTDSGIVIIYDENSDSLLVEIDAVSIIKLHNPVEDDKELICKSLTFILAFLPEQAAVDSPKLLRKADFYFPSYYYPDNIIAVMNEFISNVTQKYNKKNGGIYYVFDNEYVKDSVRKNEFYLTIDLLDDKLLKYFIIAVKNNPKYYEKNGYLIYFYDKLGKTLQNAIVSNENSIIGSVNVAAISDDEVLITDKNCEISVILKVYEDRIASKYDKYKYMLVILLHDLYDSINTDKLGETHIGFADNILDKMNSFTKLLYTSLEV